MMRILLLVSLPLYCSSLQPRNVLVIIGDDVGFDTQVYNNTVCKTPNLNALAARSLVFQNGFTSVSSCSPSRSAILTGLPQHQNGMYGLHHKPHHFNSYEGTKSLSYILRENNIRTGIIGKKHVGPESVYPFDFAATEENYNLNQVGRNITFIRQLAHKFLNQNDSRPFFLYIGLHDTHRCDTPKYGDFCEKFGNGEKGMGLIPDWKPAHYDPAVVEVPYFLPDSQATRQDIANMYTSVSRLDQGIGVLMAELEAAGHADDTLIIYSSDNGIPFPNAKTNLYNAGMGEPFLVSSPFHRERQGQTSKAMTSLLDIVPTVLDWFSISYPRHTFDYGDTGQVASVELTGKSVLPVLVKEPTTGYDTVYGSHDMHEVYMYYPMRVIRTKQYHLIHNLNYKMPYPIATDIFGSLTFMHMMNQTAAKQPLHWFKTLQQYYYRDAWELYDVQKDVAELNNLAKSPEYQDILGQLRVWCTTV